MSEIVVDTMTVKVPIALIRRRGRKRVVAPDGTESAPKPRPEIDNALVKALARAHRWQRMLEEGEYASVRDLAKAEGINPSYVSRILRLTLLSPAIVEKVLEGTHTPRMDLLNLKKPLPAGWHEQVRVLEACSRII